MVDPILSRNRRSSWTLAVGAFAVYLWTAAPSTTWFDTGELTLGAFSLGNGHPPGQPLYALAGKAATLLPLGNIPFRLALFSALCAAAVTALLPGLLEALCKAADRPSPPPILSRTLLPGLSLMLPLWLQSVRVEVYTLHLVLIMGMLSLAMRQRSEQPSPGRFLALCLLTGLSLANHHLLVFLALPGLALLVGWPGLVTAARGIAALGLGLGLYLQAPLRSIAGATLNWGHPDRWATWWAVVTGRAYQRSFTHLTLSQLLTNLELHGRLAVACLGLPLVMLAVWGLFGLRRRPRVALAIFLLIAGNVASTSMQSRFSAENPDALGYLCLSFLLMGLLAALGLDQAGQLLMARGSGLLRPTVRTGLAAVTVGVLTVAPALNAWPRPDLRADWLAQRFGRLLLDSLPPGALYLSGSDATTFASWFGQHIEGARPDVSSLALYTLGDPPPIRTVALPHDDFSTMSHDDPARRLIDRESTRRPVMMTANDLPLELENRLRASRMSFRVVPPGEISPLEAGLDEVLEFWREEAARTLADPAYLSERQARLIYPAHLEALGDHFRTVGLLAHARQLFALAASLDPDPSRLVRLKKVSLEALIKRRLEAATKEVEALTGPGTEPGSSMAAQASASIPAERVAALHRVNRALALGQAPLARAELDALIAADASATDAGKRAFSERLEPFLLLERARLARLEGDAAGVVRELARLKLREPISDLARNGLLELGSFLSAPEEEAWLRQIIPVQRDAGLLARLAKRRQATGDVSEAVRLLDTAVRLSPDRLEVYEARAWFDIEKGQLSEGLEDVRRALELDPAAPDALRAASWLYRQGVR